MMRFFGENSSGIARTFRTEKSPWALPPSRSEICPSEHSPKKKSTSRLWWVRGFTITEIIVVVAIMTLLLTVGVGYTQKGGKQIVLFREHAHLTEQILRARSFATQKLRPANELICGYGVAFLNSESYVLYRSMLVDGACPANPTANEETIEEFSLAETGVRLSDWNHADIFFSPRDGFAYFSGDRATPGQEPAFVTLSLTGADQKLTIHVNYIGQVYTE